MKRIITIIAFAIGVTASYGQSRTMGTVLLNENQVEEGYTLFTPIHSNDHRTFLIDNCGDTVHTWPTTLAPALSAKLLPDGRLLRPAVGGASPIQAGGRGGKVQIFDWDGTILWDYTYADTNRNTHHEVEMLPNGNVLILTWDTKTLDSCIAKGRNPANIPDNEIWSEKIVEVQPTGPTTGTIVWEWDIWDHMIQDFDPTKQNYGVVEDHPELIDVNYLGWSAAGKDWLHANAIDYNEELDQIVMSCRYTHEIYIIDHSTTTLEAKGHTGGLRGKGGDILYRWGNPEVYRKGTIADRQLWAQHNCQWIDTGLVDAGKIMIFNNGNNRPGGNFSSIDIIDPPMDASGNYYLTSNGTYGPSAPDWTYVDPVLPTDFYSAYISGAQRLPNGNTLICEGTWGRLFEIDPQGNKVWEYMSPVGLSGTLNQGASHAPLALHGTENWVFRAIKYPSNYPAFANKTLTPGMPIEQNPLTSLCEVAEIYADPSPANGCAADSIAFIVGAQGTVNGYQWQVNDGSGFVDLANSGVYSGVNDDTLIISDITGLDTYQYRVIGLGATTADYDTSAIVTLTVNPLPSVTLALSQTSMCIDDGAITLNGVSPAGGIFTGNGVTGTTFDPVAAGPGTHVITYTYADSNACSSSATDTITVDLCSGIEGISASWFSVKPNPSTGSITISRQNEMPQTLYVYDALGKLMNTIQVTGQEQQVDVSELPNGIYIVRCENRIVKLVMRR